jgi:hypothetical protein
VGDLLAIRQGLANNLATISGLRSAPELVDNPTPPVALVNLDSVDYDGAMQNGLTTYTFSITVIVGRAAERTMQRKLDGYLAPTGEQSVKAGVESDRTLSGECFDLRVETAQSIGSITLNDQTYLAAEFTVTVYA